MSTARQIIEASDPKRVFRKLAQKNAYTDRPIDRERDLAFHFLFGAPICMSFDIIARDIREACRIGTIHLNEVFKGGNHRFELHDDRVTELGLREDWIGFKLTEKHVLMWWRLNEQGEEEDPIMNPEHTG